MGNMAVTARTIRTITTIENTMASPAICTAV
jgi:hypothetical protein